VSDSLEDRLSKQKNAGEAKQQAYLAAMQQRAAKIDADNFAKRVPRATEYFVGLRKEIARKIGADEDLAPFTVPPEFDGAKVPERDFRLPEDAAHPVWLEFEKWGKDNGLLILMSAETPATITVTVG